MTRARELADLISSGVIEATELADNAITNAKLADDAVDSAEIAAGAIDTAHITDNQVTLAKMAGIARGKIIYGDASGDPAVLTIGGNGTALMSDGNDISWGTAGAITSYTNSTNNRVVTSVDSTTVNSEANLTFDGSVLAATGNITATGTMEPAGDTAASDNAAIGYTAAEGLILTGQGSTNDVTIKNDADAAVIQVPTGTTNVEVVGHLLPTTDDGVDLGSASKQWRNVYTGDLNLNNTNGTRVNEVDGTSGSWTIQEGDEDLFLLNRLNGKKYKFNLTEME